ncbi:MAG: diphthamide synthesis protein [Candidatus Woesearchaeota archaeon]|nr:MAG: diphthamide synthesis protein [Candidatus Woesearchaeota archaeon]
METENLSYDLEIEKIIAQITQEHAKTVLLHLPSGLKPRAKELQEAIREATDAFVLIWAGSNFGACDLPVGIEKLGIDLVVHFGHSAWVY